MATFTLGAGDSVVVDSALVVAVVVVDVVACWPTHRRSSPIAIARLVTANSENISVLLIL